MTQWKRWGHFMSVKNNRFGPEFSLQPEISGRLRISLDPKDINRAIKRTHDHPRTLEEITHKLAGATVFSKLDARHGYWSVSIDQESSMKTTYNRLFGRDRFLRLPFGLNLSQDVFQERMDQIIEQCPGTISIANDDVGVFGRIEDEHNANLHQLKRAAQKHGQSSMAISAKSKQVNCTSPAWYSIQMVSTLTPPGLTTFVV